MALNSESPYIGDKAAQGMAEVTAPNVLRAVEAPKRPAPGESASTDSTLVPEPEKEQP